MRYRLIRNYYRNRIEWEDGPGSLQNIVSKKYVSLYKEWESDSSQKEAIVEAKTRIPYKDEEYESNDEISFTLECSVDGRDWRYIDTLDEEYDRRD